MTNVQRQVLGPRAARPEPGAIAVALASFADGLRDNAIPRAVRQRALRHILDAVGIAMAVSRFDYAKSALAGLAAVSSTGEVPVLGFPQKWAPRDAATINGLLCHGLDFDDTHLEGVIHPTVA